MSNDQPLQVPGKAGMGVDLYVVALSLLCLLHCLALPFGKRTRAPRARLGICTRNPLGCVAHKRYPGCRFLLSYSVLWPGAAFSRRLCEQS